VSFIKFTVILPNWFLLNATLSVALLSGSFQSAQGARLDGAFAAVPPGSFINLTAEGATDWAHWGLKGPEDFNHKQGVVPQVGALTIVGPNALEPYSTLSHSYTWNDGTPTLTSTNNSGVLIRGLMDGFELSLSADTTVRRAKVYVGVNAAEGRFTATLGDTGVARYVDASLVDAQGSNGVYSLSYAADSPGQILAVRFTAGHLFSRDSGYVSWQAVTLAENAPPAIARQITQRFRTLVTYRLLLMLPIRTARSAWWSSFKGRLAWVRCSKVRTCSHGKLFRPAYIP
jgi:hypothetical protein